MDGPRFDKLTQRLASTRLTRGSALRGLAASTLTLAGMTTVADEATAGKKKPYCDCPDATSMCTNARAGKKARRLYLQSHPCSYKGTCQGTGSHNPCERAGAFISLDMDLLGASCTPGGGECGTESGLECGDLNTCVPFSFVGDTCQGDVTCTSGRCDVMECVLCPDSDICETGNFPLCCVVDATCISGFCVLPIDSL